LRRSGRVNSLVAGLGTLLQIKPIVKVYQGVVDSERVRTRAQAAQRLVSWLNEQGPLEHAAILHTRARDRAEALLAEVRAWLPPGEIPIVEVTPTIGTHIGPNALGFACVRAR
jgi:fatty acid-binding protein DegV